MFKGDRTEAVFQWGMPGDFAEGRPNPGSGMDVSVCRPMRCAPRDVVIQEYGVAAADRLSYQAGDPAGRELFKAASPRKTESGRSSASWKRCWRHRWRGV
jgi:hypothetical protein